MKQKLLTDIELDVHELKYLMDSFTKEPTPTLSELLKRSITRMQAFGRTAAGGGCCSGNFSVSCGRDSGRGG